MNDTLEVFGRAMAEQYIRDIFGNDTDIRWENDGIAVKFQDGETSRAVLVEFFDLKEYTKEMIVPVFTERVRRAKHIVTDYMASRQIDNYTGEKDA